MFRLFKNVSKPCFLIKNFGQRQFSQQQTAAVPELKLDKEMTPKKIVEYLDAFIVGQNEAKKSMAVALSN